MSYFTFMGRQYKTDDFLKDIISTAKELATNARIIVPLPPNTDLTQKEQKDVQEQVCTHA